MSNELRKRALDIACQLLESSVSDRASVQQALCGDDDELRRAVERCLHNYELAQADQLFQHPQTVIAELIGANARESDAEGSIAKPDFRHFTPIGQLGSGGQGDVWLVLDSRINRRVAMKFPNAKSSADPLFREKFRREFELSAKLEHPNIVPVYDVFLETINDEAGIRSSSYVMRLFGDLRWHVALQAFYEHPRSAGDEQLIEALNAYERNQSPDAPERLRLLQAFENFSFNETRPSDRTLKQAVQNILDQISEAGTLAQAITRLHSGVWSDAAFRKLLTRFQRVCEGVAYAHDRGVIHRDLKPGNIMLGEFGETLVVDWGLAKVVGTENAPSAESSGGSIEPIPDEAAPRSVGPNGTPRYMSPEQAKGLNASLTPATDIYSLGAILFEIIAGCSAIAGGSPPEIIANVIAGRIRKPTAIRLGVPVALEQIVLKAMRANPEDRYASALDLAQDVDNWLNDERVAAWENREPLLQISGRWMRRHRTLVATTAATLLVAAVSLSTLLGLLSFKNAELLNTNIKLSEANTNLTIATNDAKQNEARALSSEQELKRQLVNALLAQSDRAAAANDLLLANFSNAAAIVKAETEPRLPEHELAVLRYRHGTTADRASKLERVMFPGMPVQQVEISPDGKQIAVQTRSMEIKVYDAETGIELFESLEHPGPVFQFAYSADGDRILSWSTTFNAGPKIHLWDASSGRRLASASSPGRILDLAFFPSGRQFALAIELREKDLRGLIQICGTNDLLPIGDAVELPDPPTSVAVSPDGSTFAATVPAAENDSSSFVGSWRTDDRSSAWNVGKIDKRYVCDLAYSPDGTLLAFATNDGGGAILNARTGEMVGDLFVYREKQSRGFDGYGKALGFVCFSPDGQILATSFGDRIVRLWNATTGRPVGETMKHDDEVTSIAFSPDGRLLATSAVDGVARLWRTASGKSTSADFRHPGAIHSISFLAGGSRVLTGSEDGTLREWSPRIPRLMQSPSGDELHRSVIDPSARWMAGVTEDGTIQVWDLTSNTPAGQPLHCEHEFYRIDFASKQRWIALSGFSLDGNAKISVFDFSAGQKINEFSQISGLPLQVVFSPDDVWCAVHLTRKEGRAILLTESLDKKLQQLSLVEPMQLVWNPASSGELLVATENGSIQQIAAENAGRVVTTNISVDPGLCRQLTMSQDGKLLLTVTDSDVRLWDFANRTPLSLALHADGKPVGAALSADGTTILTWGEDGTCRLWRRAKLEESSDSAEVARVTHTNVINDAAWSPDGQLIATASSDGTTRLWDSREMRSIGPAMEHIGLDEGRAEVQFVRFANDGSRIFSGGADTRIGREVFNDGVFFQRSPDNRRSFYSTLRILSVASDLRSWEWPIGTEGEEILLPFEEFVVSRQFAQGDGGRPANFSDSPGVLREQDLPVVIAASAGLLPNQWSVRQYLAKCAARSDDSELALEHLELALRDEHSSSSLWFDYADQLDNAGRFEDGWSAANKSIELGVRNPKAFRIRARCAMRTDRFLEAEEDFAIAIQDDRVPFYARAELADCQATISKFAEAAVNYDQAFQEMRDFGEVVTATSKYRRILVELGRGDESSYRNLARVFLDEALKSEDNETAFYALLSLLLKPDATSDWRLVAALADRVAASDAEVDVVRAVPGYVAFRSGMFPVAEENLRVAIALQALPDPSKQAPSPMPHYFLALTLQALGRTAEAKQSLATGDKYFELLKAGPKEIPLYARLHWSRRLIFEVMQGEAKKALINE